jgi:hypothetical protein
MRSNILQSLISINRTNISIEEAIINELIPLSKRAISPKLYERYKTTINGHKKHLALLVRNQVAMKKALRKAYEDEFVESWRKEILYGL